MGEECDTTQCHIIISQPPDFYILEGDDCDCLDQQFKLNITLHNISVTSVTVLSVCQTSSEDLNITIIVVEDGECSEVVESLNFNCNMSGEFGGLQPSTNYSIEISYRGSPCIIYFFKTQGKFSCHIPKNIILSFNFFFLIAETPTANSPMMLISLWLTIFIPVLLTLALLTPLLICLIHNKRKKRLCSRHPQLQRQENDNTIRVAYSSHQNEKDSDYATPIDAIKTLDAAQSQRLLRLVDLTANKAFAPIETGTLEIPGQRLLAHSGPSNSSIEMCMDLYDTPADALKDEGLELTHRGVQGRVYTMANSPKDRGEQNTVYTAENSPEKKGVRRVYSMENSPEDMAEHNRVHTVENSPEKKGVHRVYNVKNSTEDMGEQKIGVPEEPH